MQQEELQSPSQLIGTQEASSDGRPPSSTPSSRSDRWADLLSSCARVALAIPFLAFVVAGMGSDQFSELSVGDVKLKTTGLREMVAIVTALLIVRFARDMSRIFAATGLGPIGLILSSSKAETHIYSDYARPVDLYEAQVGSRNVKPLRLLEKARSALIVTLASAAVVAVLIAEGNAVWNMFSAPKLAPYLSYFLAILVCVLMAIAAMDVVAIVVSCLLTTQWFKRRADWQNRVAAFEKDRVRLKHPPDLPKPLSEDELKVFRTIVKTASTAEDLQQLWEKGETRKELVIGDVEWPPASHFPFQYAWDERQKQAASQRGSHFGRQQMPAPRSKDDTSEIDKLRKEFDEEFVATANSIGRPKKWPVPFDTQDNGCSVSDYADKIKLAREKLAQWQLQRETIRWCKDEAAKLSSRLEIPQFWEEGDHHAVAAIRDQIELAHWHEKRSIWSEKSKKWVRVPVFDSVRTKALPAAIRETHKALKHHPARALAIAHIGQILTKQTWLAIRKKVQQGEPIPTH